MAYLCRAVVRVERLHGCRRPHDRYEQEETDRAHEDQEELNLKGKTSSSG